MTHTAKTMHPDVGRLCSIPSGRGELAVTVEVIDARTSWNRLQYEVKPLIGSGTAWVAAETVSWRVPLAAEQARYAIARTEEARAQSAPGADHVERVRADDESARCSRANCGREIRRVAGSSIYWYHVDGVPDGVGSHSARPPADVEAADVRVQPAQWKSCLAHGVRNCPAEACQE